MPNVAHFDNAETIDIIPPKANDGMRRRNLTLRQMCHVNENGDGDSFVGIKADTGSLEICFPIGYELPENDDDLRVDVQNLIGVLAKEESHVESPDFSGHVSVDFPIHAYIHVIRNFLNTGHYYIETETHFTTAIEGVSNWPRTFRNQMGLAQKNGSIIFTQMTVRKQTPNAYKKITQIHQYCVHKAFSKIGALYVSFVPEEPAQCPSIAESISILTDKINHTNNDMDRDLFRAMRCILTYEDSKSEDHRFFFGTNRFEYVWQSMVDTAFGIPNKDDFFPKASWLVDYGTKFKGKYTSLQPDTIMIYGDKYYILDSKYYRYGWTGDPEHLPGGPDINKQITYGEYISCNRSIPNERLFNAFILPYNKKRNSFGLSGDIENVGEAIGNWKFNKKNPNMKHYERVQGIVVDTRYLMYNYIGTPEEQKHALAKCIERVLSRPDIIPEITR